MAEIKATENGLGIQAGKITLEGPETEYVTLAVVEYDPDETTMNEGTRVKNIIVRLPTFCRQVDRGDLITFTKHLNPMIFNGKVLAKQTYAVEGDYLPMLLLAFDSKSLGTLPTVRTKIEETRVTQ